MAASDTRLIANVPLFKGLDQKALGEVTADARIVRAASGRAFSREGERAYVFYVLRRGRVKFTQISAEGHEVILRVIGTGEPAHRNSALTNSTSPPRSVARPSGRKIPVFMRNNAW